MLDELKKALAEWVLNAEIDHHLEAGEADGRTNSRNGYGKKRVLPDTGRMDLEVPGDRLSTSNPQLIAKYQRRFPGFDEKIISMYARGMSNREIQGHLRDLYGIDISPDLISAVPDAVLEEVTEWWACGRRTYSQVPSTWLAARRVRDCGPSTAGAAACLHPGRVWHEENSLAKRLWSGGAVPARPEGFQLSDGLAIQGAVLAVNGLTTM